MNQEHIPKVMIGGGIVLSALLIAQITDFIRTNEGFAPDAVITFLSATPFIVLIVGGGYWLIRSDLSANRYSRVGKWIFVGSSFLGLVFGIIAYSAEESWLVRFGILHWAISMGAGTGLLIGIFEAHAIESSLRAERTRIRNEELRKQNDRLDDLARCLRQRSHQRVDRLV